MVRRSEKVLDKLLSEPAIEKVLRAELKRYAAEEELSKQEAAAIEREAAIGRQVNNSIREGPRTVRATL